MKEKKAFKPFNLVYLKKKTPAVTNAADEKDKDAQNGKSYKVKMPFKMLTKSMLKQENLEHLQEMITTAPDTEGKDDIAVTTKDKKEK